MRDGTFRMALYLQKRGVPSAELETWSPARRFAAFVVHVEDEHPVRWNHAARRFVPTRPAG